MKIVTITLNPAIDKTIYCETFEVGATNRIQTVTEDIAGKGINVSKNLQEQGLKSQIVAVFAGQNGWRSYDALVKDNYEVVEIRAKGETRINQKIVDAHGVTTELNEQGPTLGEATLTELYDWIDEHCEAGDIFVLSGSLPNGAKPSLYRELIVYLKDKGALTILDASGPALKEAVQAAPYCIKPNDDEIQSLLNLNRKPTLAEMIDYARQTIKEGVHLVVVSLGKAGAIFVTSQAVVKADGLVLKSKSSVGAGDAMVSAIAYSLYHKEPFETLVKRAIATSGAAVETIGTKPGSVKRVQELMESVEMGDYDENKSC